ncbi:MAG TPA: Fic family protein [Anaerolineales bacterium]
MDCWLLKNSPAGRIVRAPIGYDAFVPHALPPQVAWTPQLVAALSAADRSLGELAGIGRTLANPHLLIVPFMRKEAVLSSAIEGTKASLSDLYAYEAEQLAFLIRPADVREVHNYVRALEQGILRLRTLPVSLRLIRELHHDLMEGVRGDRGTPGEFRRSQNWIGPPGCTLEDSTFVPPPTTEMSDSLGKFERYLHAEDHVPPLVRLGLIHYQFEAIHPFIDGNGRIGRLLITLLLCAWGLLPQALLYLSAYFEANRDQYYDLLLHVSQRGEWESWLTFFPASQKPILVKTACIEKEPKLANTERPGKPLQKFMRTPVDKLNGLIDLRPLGITDGAQEVLGLPSPLLAVRKDGKAVYAGIGPPLALEAGARRAFGAGELSAEFLETVGSGAVQGPDLSPVEVHLAHTLGTLCISGLTQRPFLPMS